MKISYDLKSLSFSRQNIKFTRNQDTFKNSYLFKKVFKKHVMYMYNYKHLL